MNSTSAGQTMRVRRSRGGGGPNKKRERTPREDGAEALRKLIRKKSRRCSKRREQGELGQKPPETLLMLLEHLIYARNRTARVACRFVLSDTKELLQDDAEALCNSQKGQALSAHFITR